MSRRLFVFLAVLFCTLGVLLLLSALVESPATDAALAEEAPVAHTISAFFCMPPSPSTESTIFTSAWLRVAALFAVAILMFPRLQCICDANGRVLRKRRYVHSFHLVFKQELACG